MNDKFIEVILPNMDCFKVDAETLEPLCCTYYEPAAWSDPQGRKQMSYCEYLEKFNVSLRERIKRAREA